MDNAAWSLGVGKQGKFVVTADLIYDKENTPVQLVPFSEGLSVYTSFSPRSFFGQDEDRRSVLFNMPDKLSECIEMIEEKTRNDRDPTDPDLNAMWHSTARHLGKFPSTLRAKLVPSKCGFYLSLIPI